MVKNTSRHISKSCLALDTTTDAHKAENEQLLSKLKKYFFVADCKLDEQPNQVLQKPISEGYSPITDATKDGVLMVMMENYEGKKQKFLTTGKLAVGIKYTRDGIEIAENLQSIAIPYSQRCRSASFPCEECSTHKVRR